MIDLNPDVVRFIIDKAREYQMKDALDGAEADDDSTEGAIEDWADAPTADPDDSTYVEFVSAVDDLEPDQQACLVAMTWLGRGDFDIEEWDTALEEAAQAHNARTAQYLISTPLLADYLEEALRLHGYEAE